MDPDTGSPRPEPSGERMWTLFRDAIRLLRRADSRSFRRLVLLEFAIAVMIPVQLLAARWVLSGTLDEGPSPAAGTLVSQAGTVFVCLAAVAALMAAASAARFRFPQRVATASTALLTEKVSRMRLAAVEEPAFQTRLRQAERDASWRPALMTADLVNILAAGSTVVALLVVLASAQPVVAVLCVICLAAQVWRGARSRRIVYRHLSDRAPTEQRLQYTASLLLSPDRSKEVRGFEIAGYVLSRYDTLARQADTALARTARYWAAPYYVGGLCSAALAAGGLVLLWLVQDGGTVGAADVVFIGGALLLVAVQANRLSFAVGHFSENAIFVRDFWAIMEDQRVERRGGPAPDENAVVSLEVRKVSFSYPAAEEPALSEITLRCRRGEIIGVIGHNGAGKSTLVKLLAHLYEPTAGQVLWDGTDVQTYDPVLLRRRISVVHQDYLRYDFTAAENIGIGAVGDIAGSDEIREAGRAAGVDEFLSRRAHGYDTVLGSSPDSAADLSTGEWQRIALARALVRSDAALLILDEPSASLDGCGERSLKQLLRRHAADRITIVVSHRLSTVAMADCIYLLANGRVEHVGTPQNLARESADFQELFGHQDAPAELTAIGGD